jgi:hypothetical protein
VAAKYDRTAGLAGAFAGALRHPAGALSVWLHFLSCAEVADGKRQARLGRAEWVLEDVSACCWQGRYAITATADGHGRKETVG